MRAPVINFFVGEIAMNRIARAIPGKIVLTLLAVILLLATGVTAKAGQSGKRFRNRANADANNDQLRPKAAKKQMQGAFGGGVQMRMWARLLKLSPEQIQRMRRLQRANAQGYLDIEAQIRNKRQDLELAIFSETLNEDSVRQLTNDLTRLETQRIVMRTRIQVQIRQVLTSDQLKTFNDVRFGQLGDLLDMREDREEPNAPEDKE